MAVGPCSRCGRPGPEAHAREGPWDFLDGGDVCPNCQELDEQQDVVRKARHAVRAEAERRTRDDIPPDDVELALGRWAMEAGEPREPPEPGPGSTAGGDHHDFGAREDEGPQERPDSAARDRERHFKVALTAAFFTGLPVEVHLDDYKDVRDALAGELRDPGWSVVDPRDDGTFEGGGGFKDALPLVLARREGTPVLERFRDALKDRSGEPLLKPAELGFALEPTGAEIDVYDLGVAVMTIWCDVTCRRDDLKETIRLVDEHVRLRPDRGGSPTVAALRSVAKVTLAQYERAIRQAAPKRLRPTWVSKYAPEKPGRLLWVHPVNVVLDEEPSATEAKRYAPACHTTVKLYTEAWLAAGVGWSVILAPEMKAAEPAVRLTQLHWAYYALYMEMDRGLLAVLDRSRLERKAKLSVLEDEAEDVFADYVRAMNARARLDSELASLGGDEFAIWQAIAEAQRFEPIVEAVERKLDVLQRATQRRVDLAEANRTRHLGIALAALSTLAIASLIVALATYRFGSSTPNKDDTARTLFVVSALVLAAVVFLLGYAYFRPPRRRRPAPTAPLTAEGRPERPSGE